MSVKKRNKKISIKKSISKLLENTSHHAPIIAGGITVCTLLVVGYFVYNPSEAEALSVLAPFGGRVESYLPSAPGCAPITAAISLATLGTVNVTIEEVVVGGPKAATLGLLRVDGATIPALTDIYSQYAYQIPGNYVLGQSFNVCKLCSVGGSLTNAVCQNKAVKALVDAACSSLGGACPVTNLIYSVGTGLPSITD